MNKLFRVITLALFIIFSIACNVNSPSLDFREHPLEVAIVFQQETFQSFEDVSATVSINNAGKEDLLVNKQLLCIAKEFPPEVSVCKLLITDSSGNPIWLSGKIDFAFPRDEFFVVLPPGQTIEKRISLQSVGFRSHDFQEDEIYTVMVIYQNLRDVTQMVNDKKVRAWKGEVQSNTDTFTILP